MIQTAALTMKQSCVVRYFLFWSSLFHLLGAIFSHSLIIIYVLLFALQQLREVLAKQRELGVEVAEVPSHYLSNPVEEVSGDNSGQFQNKDGKKGRFGHSKRKYGEKNKFNKKQKFQDQDSSQESSVTTRKPTLLEKLLSADIKRDKIQLLQVLRFVVMNSYFNESPEDPLKFPLVMVEETDCEHAEDVLSDDDVDENGDDDSCDEVSD